MLPYKCVTAHLAFHLNFTLKPTLTLTLTLTPTLTLAPRSAVAAPAPGTARCC